jgi:hypothetical protein
MRPLPHNSGGPSTHGSTPFSLHQQQAHNSPHAQQPQVKETLHSHLSAKGCMVTMVQKHTVVLTLFSNTPPNAQFFLPSRYQIHSNMQIQSNHPCTNSSKGSDTVYDHKSVLDKDPHVLDLPDPDPLVRGINPDLAPDPSG